MSATRNLIYNIVITVLNVAIPIVTVPYTSRVFGVENIGVINFAMTYASYFALFICLGIPIYGIREIGKCRDDKPQRDVIVSELMKILTISTIIFTTIYAITIATIPTLRQEWEFLAVSGVGLVLAPFGVDWYFTGRENLRVVAVRSFIIKVLGMIALFTFVRDRQDLLLYLILNTIIISGSQIWTFIYMLKTEVTLKWRNINTKRHFKPVLILFMSSLAISIYTMLDTLMLGFLTDYKEVGYYTSAIKISRLILPIVTAASAVALPRLAHLFKEQNYVELNRVANKSFSFVSLLAPPMTFGLIAITPKFVPLFFGTEFMGVIPSMMVVSSLVLLVGINNFYGSQLLIGSGKDKVFMSAVIVGTITNFILNLILIPFYGSVGASFASVIAEIGVTIMVMVYCIRLLPEVKVSYRPFFNSIISSLPMFVYSYLFTVYVESDFLAVTFITICSAITFTFLEWFVFKEPAVKDIKDKVLIKLHLK